MTVSLLSARATHGPRQSIPEREKSSSALSLVDDNARVIVVDDERLRCDRAQFFGVEYEDTLNVAFERVSSRKVKEFHDARQHGLDVRIVDVQRQIGAVLEPVRVQHVAVVRACVDVLTFRADETFQIDAFVRRRKPTIGVRGFKAF